MNKKYFATVLTLPILAGALLAQVPKAQALLMALSANSKEMTAYQWKERIVVVRRGTPAATIVEELRFDPSGRVQRMTLSRPAEKHMGPLRARKIAETKEDVREVMQLAGRYANPQQIAQAIRKGEVWEGSGTLRVQARALILPSDEMTLIADASSLLATRAEFKTEHEGRPVTILVDYQRLANGPSMMVRMSVRIPKDDIAVNVESYDFVRLAAANTPQF
jgi:hypothetical protein